MDTLYASIQQKLQITSDKFNSLFTTCPVDGAVGTVVAEAIRARFEIPADAEDLGYELNRRGIITDAEERVLADDSEENVAEAVLNADPQIRQLMTERPGRDADPDDYAAWVHKVFERGGELLRAGGFSDRLSVAVDYLSEGSVSVLELH